MREELKSKKGCLEKAKYSLIFYKYDFSIIYFYLKWKRYWQLAVCLRGQEMIKRKNFLSKPEHLLVVISSSAIWLFLSLYNQPFTYHWPDSQHRKAPLEVSCTSLSFRAGLAGKASAPASASHQNMRFPPACCSVLAFGRRIFSSPVCFHLLLSTPGNTAFFFFLMFILKPILMKQLAS